MDFNIYLNGEYDNSVTSFPWELIPGIASAISAFLLLWITYRIFKWDSKRDIVDYVPQLFLRSENEPVLHPVFSRENSMADFYSKEPYQFSLVNISDKKIVDLEVESEVIEDKGYKELLNCVHNSKEFYIDWVDDQSFAYEGTLGDDYKSHHKEDLLSGDETVEIKIPGSFHLALLGYNLMAKEQAADDFESRTIKIRMYIKYNHAFTEETVIQECYFTIKFRMGHNNTDVEWDSYLFKQK